MATPTLIPEYEHASGALAAHRLFSACFTHAGGSTQPIAEFLIGLYNGEHARPAPYQLCRRISTQDFEDIITVMKWFRTEASSTEIHTIYGQKGSQVMRELMKRFGLGAD